MNQPIYIIQTENNMYNTDRLITRGKATDCSHISFYTLDDARYISIREDLVLMIEELRG
jgi:hypothetical protein